jgi:hypothetical protein
MRKPLGADYVGRVEQWLKVQIEGALQRGKLRRKICPQCTRGKEGGLGAGQAATEVFTIKLQ